MTRYFVLSPSREFRSRQSSSHQSPSHDHPNGDLSSSTVNAESFQPLSTSSLLSDQEDPLLACHFPFIALFNQSSFLPRLWDKVLHLLVLLQTALCLLITAFVQFYKALLSTMASSTTRLYIEPKNHERSSRQVSEGKCSTDVQISPSSHEQASEHDQLDHSLISGDAQEALPAVKVIMHTDRHDHHHDNGSTNETLNETKVLKIVVAASNTIHRMVLIKTLKRLGQEIILSVNDGKQLLDTKELVRGQVNVVFMDEEMLKQMEQNHPLETRQLLQSMRKRRTNLVIVSNEEKVQSSSTIPGCSENSLNRELPFCSKLRNPLTMKELEEVIKEIHSIVPPSPSTCSSSIVQNCSNKL
ncbi:hypothetical protein FDP41_011009 [Naegleria fowleri]|uniref:Uncharacterized protein n=1 Tax=Naegleria fowleri TaxID=5763 RepID=A0A6A5C7C9_NAEFO|nr:uncharacterized protein FDP41_011009 [Naegleria fowleri]KAF0983031.1 hypothetical protein FDP41_011009 [Naegleria fowleri]CAG4708408.1 unnamed protein product [Naegleria fowleri]